MSRCLCCGKELRNGNEYGWHSACVKSFFGTTKFPDIDVSKETYSLTKNVQGLTMRSKNY